ncbi:DNA ligase D [Luteolibacter algae]|uniref:DNA ligase (ATP) n=1 Tax=Luteolibacter algae TaxID=454151 RepID=A0ABW5D8Z6_9BACT
MPRKNPAAPSPKNRLEPYRRKRNFGKTPEPDSAQAADGGMSFVVQEHHARSLHYDFRLEMDGVLVSWAVPKGIPEDTTAKRLAVHVEDHPLDYGKFEGEIPKGNYGAGQVHIWDAGIWEPLSANWKKSFEKGKLKFRLRGGRLHGSYLLAQMGEEPNWLLRLLETDAEDAPATLPRESPQFIEPQLARVVSSVPSGKNWGHEIKFDGYRLIAVKSKSRVTLFTRNGHDWTEKFGSLAESITSLAEQDFVLDGEAVVFDEKGRSSFGALQAALKEGGRISFVAFDLLNLGGRNLRDLPLRRRAEQLAELIGDDGERVRLSKIWSAASGQSLFQQACKHGLEGIISKKLDGRYLPGTRNDWVKSKCRARQEFIICGYTAPKGSREGFGALLLASHENGKLVPRGKVGTGFSDKIISELMEKFQSIRRSQPAFHTTERGVTWLAPELVAEIEFAEITRDGSIRQGSFIGLRQDKSASEVRLETLSPMKKSTVMNLKITHPDRVIYPGLGVTKLEVAEYYEKTGDLMMPYIAGRPLAVLRAPERISGDMFFQKSFTRHIPDGVKASVLEDGSEIFSIHNTAGLVSLAQYGIIEIHPWGSTVDKPDMAEFLTWDLDPDAAVAWEEVLGAAFLLRDTLREMGLEPMVKFSGGKGLHLMLRIRRDHEWAEMKAFSKNVSAKVAAMNGNRFTIVASKAKRKGKIFIDWMRNGKGATCVAPWSLRARKGAAVSMPVSWEDLANAPQQGFNLHEPPQTPAEWLKPQAQRITRAMLEEASRFAL